MRHGTTNLFAALNVGTGEVFGECRPSRDGDTFLAFLKKAVKPHAGKEIHVVLDNLSTHTTPRRQDLAGEEPERHFHFTPVGSSWINQIETWFGIITRQAIRRGTFSSVKVLIKRIRDYIAHWNDNAETVRLDRHRRRDPRQGPHRPGQHQEACRQQREVKTSQSRNTSCTILFLRLRAFAAEQQISAPLGGSVCGPIVSVAERSSRATGCGAHAQAGQPGDAAGTGTARRRVRLPRL